MDGEAWRATVHGVTKSRTRLSDFTHYSPSNSLQNPQFLMENGPFQLPGYFIIFLATPCGMKDLCSLTRDQTRTSLLWKLRI